MPEQGQLLDHGSETHDGRKNVCRVVGVKTEPSEGFEAEFVNPDYPRQRRLGTDRPFFVWKGSAEHKRMKPWAP